MAGTAGIRVPVSIRMLVVRQEDLPVPRGQGAALPTVSDRPSPHSWVVGNWSRCSRSCDAGVRSRSVVCQRRVSAAEEKALDDSACPQPRPPVLEACHGPACPPEWAALDWSEVSRPFLPAAQPVLPRQNREGPWWPHVGCRPPRRLPTPAGPSGAPVIGPKLAIPSSIPTESASSPLLVQAGSRVPTEHETPPPNCSAPPAAGRASATAWSSVRAQITAPHRPPRIASPRPSHQPPCAATCAAALRPAGWRGSGAR